MRRVQFFPAGEFRSGDVRPEDVPAWRIDAASAAAVIQRFNARQKPLVVDYEHQTLNKERTASPLRLLAGRARWNGSRAKACSALSR